jgi:hypothetical protein
MSSNFEDHKGHYMIPGTLEIDAARGVIYFHLDNPGNVDKMGTVTVLRICRLPPIPNLNVLLDITHMVGVSWATLNADHDIGYCARCRAKEEELYGHVLNEIGARHEEAMKQANCKHPAYYLQREMGKPATPVKNDSESKNKKK